MIFLRSIFVLLFILLGNSAYSQTITSSETVAFSMTPEAGQGKMDIRFVGQVEKGSSQDTQLTNSHQVHIYGPRQGGFNGQNLFGYYFNPIPMYAKPYVSSIFKVKIMLFDYNASAFITLKDGDNIYRVTLIANQGIAVEQTRKMYKRSRFYGEKIFPYRAYEVIFSHKMMNDTDMIVVRDASQILPWSPGNLLSLPLSTLGFDPFNELREFFGGSNSSEVVFSDQHLAITREVIK